mmetsp:Transcript_10387/g.34154  ORF Transcript_10387/g.34154 Transcript_10387/m.34154 type:complete len:688 (-) Transcript_10387:3-2066(-)
MLRWRRHPVRAQARDASVDGAYARGAGSRVGADAAADDDARGGERVRHHRARGDGSTRERLPVRQARERRSDGGHDGSGQGGDALQSLQRRVQIHPLRRRPRRHRAHPGVRRHRPALQQRRAPSPARACQAPAARGQKAPHHLHHLERLHHGLARPRERLQRRPQRPRARRRRRQTSPHRAPGVPPARGGCRRLDARRRHHHQAPPHAPRDEPLQRRGRFFLQSRQRLPRRRTHRAPNLPLLHPRPLPKRIRRITIPNFFYISSHHRLPTAPSLLTAGIPVFFVHLFDFREALVRELERKGVDVLLELRFGRGPDDGGADEPARAAKGDGELRRREAVLLSDLRVLLDRLACERLVEAVHVAVKEAEARPLRRLVREVLARKRPARERGVREEAHVAVARGARLREVRLERRPNEERVAVLDGANLGQGSAASVCEPRKLGDAPRRLVTHAHVAHLALLDQLRHRLELVLERHRVVALQSHVVRGSPEQRHVTIWPVDLEQINIVRLEAGERFVDALKDVARPHARPLPAVPHPHQAIRVPRNLAREHDRVTLLVLEPRSDVPVRVAVRLRLGRHAVQLRRVDKVDTLLVNGVVELLVRLSLSVLLAPRHRTQAAFSHDEIRVPETSHGRGRARLLLRHRRRGHVVSRSRRRNRSSPRPRGKSAPPGVRHGSLGVDTNRHARKVFGR